jgi:hypothetical protein
MPPRAPGRPVYPQGWLPPPGAAASPQVRPMVCACVADRDETTILRPCGLHDQWARATYGRQEGPS